MKFRVPALKHVLSLLRRQKRLVLRFALTSLGRTGLVMASILLIREFLVGVLGGGDGVAAGLAHALGEETALWGVAVLLVASYVGASLLLYDNQVVRQRIIKVVEIGVMERLIRHLLTLSVPFFERQSHGDLIQAIRQDVSHLRTVILAYATLLMEGAVALGLIGSAVWLSPQLAFWVLLVLPIASLPVVLIASRTRARSIGVRRRGYVLFDAILQMMRGIRIIKAYQGEQAEAQTTVDKARSYFDQMIHLTRVQQLANVTLESLAGLSISVVIIVGGFQVMNGTLGWPALLAFLMAVRTLQGPLNNVNNDFMVIQRYHAAAQRISELLEERPDVWDAPDAKALTRPPDRIRLENVGFAYGSRTVLEGIDLEINAGETIGVAGPSGAGKTTLLSLVARFYDPTWGAVRFDETDVRTLRLADVYAKLALVTQEPFLFEASVRDNIRCGRPDATDEEVRKASEVADVHEEILQLPDGYDTVVGVGAGGVSSGQAQRINVARALVKNAPILLLDEATSSLDSISEARVQRAIERLMQGRTSLIVAHRLSTLRHADRIVVLDAGRCVGLGSHETLLRDCPLYRRMWETQQLGGREARPEGESERDHRIAQADPLEEDDELMA